MNKNGTLTKILAVVGTVLVWLPILAPLLLGLVSLAVDGIFRLDYLMPAELFLLVLAGGAGLIWAAFRARAHLALIAGSAITAIIALVGSQFVAVITGLASGETAIGGWAYYLVLAIFAIYILSVMAMGVGGVLLLRDLFRSPRLKHGS